MDDFHSWVISIVIIAKCLYSLIEYIKGITGNMLETIENIQKIKERLFG